MVDPKHRSSWLCLVTVPVKSTKSIEVPESNRKDLIRFCFKDCFSKQYPYTVLLKSRSGRRGIRRNSTIYKFHGIIQLESAFCTEANLITSLRGGVVNESLQKKVI